MNNKNIIKILDECIEDIINNNYSSKYKNFGYSYSDSITKIFKILSLDEYSDIYINALNNYDFNRRKELDQKENPDNFDLTDCIVYFNWVWHLEGTGLASGIINKRIENGKYLKALIRFKTLMEEKMISNMDEFSKQYPNAVIVNYDWHDIVDMEYGLCYRTSKHFTKKQSMEKLRKYKNKYITYPYIQEYQSLDNPRIDVFILHNKKCYKLKRKNNFEYSIEKEINTTEDFYKDDIFYKYYKKAKNPVIINEELLKIEE